MPDYFVQFPEAVTYLAGHPRERVTASLVVAAADPVGAMLHAVRVTSGSQCGRPPSVYDAASGARLWGDGPDQVAVDLPPSLPVEAPQDRMEVFHA